MLNFLAGGGGGGGAMSATLVLKQFDCSTSDESGQFITIVGRPSGLMALILSLIGLVEDTKFTVTASRVDILTTNLSGKLTSSAPLHNIASTVSGYSKNLGWLFAAIAVLIAGFGSLGSGEVWPFIVMLLLAIVFFVLYVFSRRFIVAVETNGGSLLGVRFKGGVIAGITIDLDKVNDTTAVINELIGVNPKR